MSANNFAWATRRDVVHLCAFSPVRQKLTLFFFFFLFFSFLSLFVISTLLIFSSSEYALSQHVSAALLVRSAVRAQRTTAGGGGTAGRTRSSRAGEGSLGHSVPRRAFVMFIIFELESACNARSLVAPVGAALRCARLRALLHLPAVDVRSGEARPVATVAALLPAATAPPLCGPNAATSLCVR